MTERRTAGKGPRRRFGWLPLAALLAAVPVWAAATVPPALTVKIIMAAVAFDRSIDVRFGDAVEIAVIGGSDRAADLAEVIETYSDKKLKGKPIVLERLSEAELKGGAAADIVFFAEPLDEAAAEWAARCQEQQSTCVSADEDGVAHGLALGVEVTAAGKPKLLINLDAAKAAGANFSAQVLKLARLVKGR